MPWRRFVVESTAVPAVPPALWDEVWALAERFTETTRPVFEASVREKKELVAIRERAGRRLVGVGAVDVSEVEHGGRRRVIVYAGNTLFEESARGANVIQRIGFRGFLRARRRRPLAPIDFFFDTYSDKSYLVEFWPRRDRPMPAEVAARLQHLARRQPGLRRRRHARRPGSPARRQLARRPARRPAPVVAPAVALTSRARQT